jgi:UDP-N-acetylglucosamine/UDP-N-acetylgalactosamine diphosphorylase
VGCLLVAGGQGSRLSFEGPKGTFPVSLIQHKSLFQLFAERTLAAGKQVERVLTLAIMTSPQNHEETVQFFDDHARFGLTQDQLFFFKQEELPFLNDQGHLMLNASKIAKGPDGNGSALTHFITSGIGRIWQQQGIEYINFILVDNPLADPFDAELIGFHARNHCDITVKCIAKENPDEQVGVLVKTPNGTRIVEYSEMNISDREARNNDGSLQYQCANISLFCFSLSFINTAMKSASLPWHLAYKAIHPNGPKGWKFETFIFDWMAYTQKIKALLYPRAQCFAPLKNISGKDSLADVQQALLHYDREILQTLCGQPVSTSPIELHPQFYYPTEKLVNTWKQKDAFSLNGYLKF